MSHSKLRRQIAWHAARLLYCRFETEVFRARIKAARHLAPGWVGTEHLPSNLEVRKELEQLTAEYQDAGNADLRELFEVAAGMRARYDAQADRYRVYEALLLPLENVRQSPKYHPEGDALYHSLQVFDLARDELPYDEEFLLAALLHDVGKAIDPQDHVAAGLEALDGYITDRTAWLMENHGLGRTVLDRTIGVRARRRLEQEESYEELMLLVRCDRDGRQRGVRVPDVHEALDYLRNLDEENRGEQPE